MANSISGRVIAVSAVTTVASADASKQPLKKRMVYLDCTRYDPYTGERSQFENKPLMEFTGDRVLEKVNPKLDGIKAGDVVTVFFDVQGMDYTDKATGKKRNFTGIRAYDVQVVRQAGDQQGQQQGQFFPNSSPQPQPQAQQQQQVQQVAQQLNAQPVQDDNGLPF
jgi:hypothetical protein